MKKVITLMLSVFVFAGNGNAQLYLEPVIGFQTDLINSSHFNQLNSAIQVGLKKSKYYELIFQLQINWPISIYSHDSSFSQNPAVPLFANAKKTMQPFALSIAAGNRTPMLGRNTNNIISLIAYGGVAYQKIIVTYQYDKSNYIILNPDKSQKRIGVFLSCGVEYMRLLKNGRAFIQVIIATPPVGKEMNYPSSFSFIAPLSLNAGYSIPIKRNRHGK
ncbi:MAG: hypothetical protein ABIN89_27365 [Chitinophagaceae bacterium]